MYLFVCVSPVCRPPCGTRLSALWPPQYTATESTNYFFDVEASQLKGATDRFSQFFQTPLFSASALERELQAVDSEHSNNKNDDSWRLYQVLWGVSLAEAVVVVVVRRGGAVRGRFTASSRPNNIILGIELCFCVW